LASGATGVLPGSNAKRKVSGSRTALASLAVVVTDIENNFGSTRISKSAIVPSGDA
jgi:hypothetical protein